MAAELWLRGSKVRSEYYGARLRLEVQADAAQGLTRTPTARLVQPPAALQRTRQPVGRLHEARRRRGHRKPRVALRLRPLSQPRPRCRAVGQHEVRLQRAGEEKLAEESSRLLVTSCRKGGLRRRIERRRAPVGLAPRIDERSHLRPRRWQVRKGGGQSKLAIHRRINSGSPC